jgi:hypothetical protein
VYDDTGRRDDPHIGAVNAAFAGLELELSDRIGARLWSEKALRLANAGGLDAPGTSPLESRTVGFRSVIFGV